MDFREAMNFGKRVLKCYVKVMFIKREIGNENEESGNHIPTKKFKQLASECWIVILT